MGKVLVMNNEKYTSPALDEKEKCKCESCGERVPVKDLKKDCLEELSCSECREPKTLQSEVVNE